MAGIGRAFFEGQDAQRQSALADLALEQQRQQMLSQNKEQSVSEEFRRLQFMNNAGRALLGVPAQQRAAAFQRLIPAANSVGIDAAQFTPDQLTDENLNQLVSSTTAFLQNPQQLTSALQERQALLGALDGAVDQATGKLKPREQLTPSQLSAAIDLGLESRAVGSAAQTIAQTGNVENVAQVEERLAGAKETGKQQSKLLLEPQIEQAVTSAREEAKQIADEAAEKKSNETAFSVYTASINNLTSAFGNASTGPGMALLPAITADRRILDGAIAVMGPTLKQLFRSAGEGTFTDKDQEQLNAMLPSANDTEEVAMAKLNFIDSTVRAKLKQAPKQKKDVKSLSDDDLLSF